MEKLFIYYLLYKLKDNHTLWIVKTSDSLFELNKHIKDFSSKYEKYYIIEREINENEVEKELERKQFLIYKTKKTDQVITETK